MSSRILRRIACTTIALGIGVLWTPSSANANMRLELESGGQGTILTDTTNNGALTTTTAFGNFIVNVTTGTSFPPLPPPPGEIAKLDLNSIVVSSGSAGTITIILENSSYIGPNGVLGAVGSIGGTISNGTVTATSYVDPTNQVPITAADQGLGALTVPGMPGSGKQDLSFTGSSSSFSADGGTTFSSTGTFSLYQELVITFGANGGTFSADLSNTVVPEPPSLAIAGIGALGVIGYGLRRRKAPGA